jgi:Ca-activated chloride channel family protein
MKKNESINQVDLQILTDKQVVASDKPCTRILEISVTPPENENLKERAPLNLSLVLDRSGSMAGEKLHFAKQAAAQVVDLLGEKDRVSITVYDNTVETTYASEFMTAENKKEAKSQIQKTQSRGSTFLSGGWLKGCEEVARGATDSTINRTLLLTDGLANVGARNPDELAMHSREIYLRGVATSCFGIGLDYDEHLLEAMANAGGGNFHFLETINAIPLEFEREFEELIKISLRDTEVSIQPPPGVKVEATAGYRVEFSKDRYNLSFGSLYSGKPKSIFLKLHFDKSIENSEGNLVVTVRGKGDGDYLCEDKKTITFKFVSTQEEKATEPDKLLMERFTIVEMADKADEALKRERAGDRAGASQIMDSSIHEYQMNMPAPMIDKFQHMSSQMKTGLDENARKRYHQEEYSNKRGLNLIKDYRLQLVNGHLVTEIEGSSVLIDTGIPISLGKNPQWHFLNEVHPLSPVYMGVTLDYISKMVGTKVDILLGMDILKKLNMNVELPGQRITFSKRPAYQSEHKTSLFDFMGVPIAKLSAGGNESEVFIDTGAKLSYIDHTIADGYTPIGKENDFYPGMGEFETNVYGIPFEIGSLKFELRCGVLPGLLEKAILVTGKRGIIGAELYQKFLVQLAFLENTIYLSDLH